MVFVLHQIELDLLRTLPNNRHYATVDSPGICKLRNVLLAYSWHNPSIGYCQVGVALILDTLVKVLRQLFWLFVWVLLYMFAIFSNYLQYVPHPISTQFDKNTQGLINESIVFQFICFTSPDNIWSMCIVLS